MQRISSALFGAVYLNGALSAQYGIRDGVATSPARERSICRANEVKRDANDRCTVGAVANH
jgi:hypothetical protein